MTVDGGPRDWRRELVVPLVDVLVKVLLVHQPVQVEEAGLPDEGEDNKLESKILSLYSQFRLYGLRIYGLFGHMVRFLLVPFVNGY